MTASRPETNRPRTSRGRFRIWSYSRPVYIALALATITVGLAIHFGRVPLAATTSDVLGDALWAAMIVWWIGALVPSAKLRIRSALAYAICAAVELSQLYHAPALDALRDTRLGQLVLGSGFDSRDLVSYAMGVLGATLLELAAKGWTRRAAAG